MLLAVGLIHLIPLKDVFGTKALTLLYGLKVTERNLLTLMHHRACLFESVGLLRVFVTLDWRFQRLAIIFGFISVMSFLTLT